MANSFKQMTKSGLIKRTDTGMFIDLADTVQLVRR